MKILLNEKNKYNINKYTLKKNKNMINKCHIKLVL